MSVRSRSNWNLKVLVFKERGKPEYPEKNLSEQGREPTTNSTQIWRRRQDSNPGHIGGRRVLSPLRHPCSPNMADEKFLEFPQLHVFYAQGTNGWSLNIGAVIELLCGY